MEMRDYEILLDLAARKYTREWLKKLDDETLSYSINMEAIYTIAGVNDVLNTNKTDEEKIKLITAQLQGFFNRKK